MSEQFVPSRRTTARYRAITELLAKLLPGPFVLVHFSDDRYDPMSVNALSVGFESQEDAQKSVGAWAQTDLNRPDTYNEGGEV